MADKILNEEEKVAPSNFIHDFIDEDLREGVYDHVQTRFPPEPNGYLHIGHAKAICINYATAKKYHGKLNLRLDDTNPGKEDVEYAESIRSDMEWLLDDKLPETLYASDYFDFMYECAIKLIKKGKAFVCDLSADEIREYRGTLTEPGKNSPYRDRSIEENMDLFTRMTNGEFKDGERVLRAKIDMTAPNINMRDPVIYRIAHLTHYKAGDKWCVYPMYDFAHPLEDAKEGVTHSLCSLEFENHRPLYDWVLRECEIKNPPRQIEFARLNLNYCVTSKRRSLYLVNNGYVDGWDDPRMVTISGMRRRGFPAAAIRDFCERIGVSKAYSVVDFGLLEACVRDNLNENAKRAMAVLHPLKLIIDNYPEGKTEDFEVEYHPNRPELGTRTVKFSREIYVERDDFMIDPPNRKYFRLYPGNEVRLKSTYFVTCNSFEQDEDGNVTCLHCTYDPESRGGNSPDGRKVRGTIHWVNAEDAKKVEVRLYDRLFNVENPSDDSKELKEYLNPNSLEILDNVLLEGGIDGLKVGDTFQFMRKGYYTVDKNSTDDKIIFNRTVDLNSSWK